jgi:glycosyl transferase family 1
LALGRPVVTTYVAGIPELVTHQTCGWLAPAGSVDQLASAIRQCLSAPDALIQTMGAAGRKRVLEQHDIAKECRKLADLFRGQASARPEPEEPVSVDQGEPVDEPALGYVAAHAGGREMMPANVVSLFSTYAPSQKR